MLNFFKKKPTPASAPACLAPTVFISPAAPASVPPASVPPAPAPAAPAAPAAAAPAEALDALKEAEKVYDEVSEMNNTASTALANAKAIVKATETLEGAYEALDKATAFASAALEKELEAKAKLAALRAARKAAAPAAPAAPAPAAPAPLSLNPQTEDLI